MPAARCLRGGRVGGGARRDTRQRGDLVPREAPALVEALGDSHHLPETRHKCNQPSERDQPHFVLKLSFAYKPRRAA